MCTDFLTKRGSKIVLTFQVLRVQCAEGTQRVEVSDSEPTSSLFEQIHNVFGLSNFAFALHKDRQRKEEVLSSKTHTLRDCGLKHGDMLFMSPLNGALIFEQPSTSSDVSSRLIDLYLDACFLLFSLRGGTTFLDPTYVSSSTFIQQLKKKIR